MVCLFLMRFACQNATFAVCLTCGRRCSRSAAKRKNLAFSFVLFLLIRNFAHQNKTPNQMKRISFLLTLFMFIGAEALAQFQNPVTFSATQKKVADDVLEVIFQGTIDAGWHVYGTDIADGGPTRAELTLETQKGVKPDGKLRATGKVQKKMDEMFGMEVSYMEGAASFVQRFIITEPEYEVAGYLTYGACNDENCIPPTDVEFSFKGEKTLSNSPLKGEDKVASEPVIATDTASIAISPSDENSTKEVSPRGDLEGSLWSPVVDELKAFEEASSSLPLREGRGGSAGGLWSIFLLGLLGGLIALLTPCVWPIIPMTVSFFLKRSEDKKKGIRDAITYGISIVVIYVLLGLLVTLIFGASALNALSTNAVFNLFFCLNSL